MTLQHTPGPWKAEKDAHGRWSIDKEDDSAWVARTVPMCDLKTNKALFDTEADARLIAAAPEMLASLRFAVALLKPMFGCTAQVQRLQAVILKATGAHHE